MNSMTQSIGAMVLLLDSDSTIIKIKSYNQEKQNKLLKFKKKRLACSPLHSLASSYKDATIQLIGERHSTPIMQNIKYDLFLP